MSKLATFVVIFIMTLFSHTYAAAVEPMVLVSVAPYKFFVEKIAQDTVKVGLMVPAGASSHTYEPTPKQILSAANADIWFCIGESFEARAVRALTSHNPKMQKVDLRKGVDLIKADPHLGVCCCCAGSEDLHIWLSPKEVKIQAATIANALSQRYPEHAELYTSNLASFLRELDDLNLQVIEILKPLTHRIILVSHPAYAYFCRDYDLTQMSIEFEGKDPTPQQLNNILNKARANNIKKVYIQAQYSSKGAKLIAKEIGAQIVMLDPYAENYFQSMLDIAKAFSQNDVK